MPDTVRILFIGDVVGTEALKTLLRLLPALKAKYRSDVVIVNGENIADGKSLKKQHANELFEAGVGIITTGNHVWDRWDIRALLAEERRLLRPANYPRENPGAAYGFIEWEGIKIGVVNLQARTYMQTIDCPFHIGDWAVERMAAETPIIFVDFHGEATAEKQAMGRYLDGRVTAVVGTHTHVQTADEQIFPNGTAYITDVGMTGPYASVIGMKVEIAVKRFLYHTPFKYETAENEIRIAGVVVEADIKHGYARSIERFMFPELERTWIPPTVTPEPAEKAAQP